MRLIQTKKPACSPRLETILMVERFLAANSGKFTRFQVWQRLPRKTMYQTFQVILAYLEDSTKIRAGPDGKIAWTGPKPKTEVGK